MTLLCDQCDYDLRAQPEEGVCPECGMSVAASVEAAKVPRRPVWGQSDRWWRVRMLAGLWVLVLLPLPTLLEYTGVSEHIPLPSLFGQYDAGRTVRSDSLLSSIDPCLTFFIGTVLLFGRERNRRPHRRDWLKRWGLLGSCIVAFLGVASLAFIASLVGLGISALIHSMPLNSEPAIYPWIYHLSHGYMLYGPQPSDATYLVPAAVSALVILLACSPIYDALQAVGLKKLAWIIPAPLAALAIGQLFTVGIWTYDPTYVAELLVADYFFQPEAINTGAFAWYGGNTGHYSTGNLVQESVKWSVILTVALTLSAAQIYMMFHRKAAA